MHKLTFLSVFICIVFNKVVFANEPIEDFDFSLSLQNEASYFEDFNVSYCECKPLFVWIPSLTYRGGDGRSYDFGYESFGTFLSLYKYPNRHYPFLDIELHRVDEGKFAANIGLGWRMLSRTTAEMLGLNIFYDYRYLRQGGFHQIGLGAEFLGPSWDIRVNGYIPVGQNRALLETTVFSFFDNLFITRDRLNAGMWGLDVEIGTCLFSNCCFDLYGAIGPYYYNSLCCNTLIGGMGRIAVKFTKFLSFQLIVTHDPIFHTKVQGEIYFSLLFPCAIECLKCIFPPIWRNRIILLEEICWWDSNF